MAALPAENLLRNETSPYLRQHRDNPVHWRVWGDAAFADARVLNRPVLLSVGYAACHWCHVMAHESFEDDDTARRMNALFVNIKVDREERPDVDTLYQSALAMMGEQGGWPLTMFLTATGEPFWGGTYFPPLPGFGRPGFRQLLEQVATIYTDHPGKVRTNADALRDGLVRLSGQARGAEAAEEALTVVRGDDVAMAALPMIDRHRGGTRGAPKFPQPGLFRFLWQVGARRNDDRLKHAVTCTLDNLCQGGIYDHLGGGFARYSTDAHWRVPHFEKMLYDNALLVELLSDVWATTGAPLYAVRVRETIAWMRRELMVSTPQGVAFASAFDADSEGVEGRFYTWSADDIAAALSAAGLGEHVAEFASAYGVQPDGNWEGVNILHRTPDDRDDDAARAARLARCRAVLFDIRRNRVRPGRDDKVLADWNGLAIAGLARAGMVFDEPDWLRVATHIFRFVRTAMADGTRLRHTWCDGDARHPAVLDDYAHLARAALMLYQATQDESCLDAARAWVGTARDHYRDDRDGLYFLAADDTRDLPFRPKALFDNATPGGNGVLAEVMARLWLLTGEDGYREAARTLIRALTPREPQGLLNQPGVATAVELMEQGLRVVIAGSGAQAEALFRTACRAAPPTAVVSRVGDTNALPTHHPAAGASATNDRPSAYVCRGTVCSLPVHDAATLKRRLLQG